MLLVTFIMLVYKQKKYAFSKIEWLWFSQGFKFTSLYIYYVKKFGLLLSYDVNRVEWDFLKSRFR